MNQATIDNARREVERERRYRESMQRLRDDRPHNAIDCTDCCGDGYGSTHDSLHPWREHDVECSTCRGMGWVMDESDDGDGFDAERAFEEAERMHDSMEDR